MPAWKKWTVRVIFALMAFVYFASHFMHPAHAQAIDPGKPALIQQFDDLTPGPGLNARAG